MTLAAVVGLGLIGSERLRALQTLRASGHEVSIVGAFDPSSRASELTRELDVTLFEGLEPMLDAGVDVLFVATPHDVAVDILRAVLPTGIRVMVEKPLGRSAREARSLDAGLDQVWVGMNYRYFRGIEQLLADAASGIFGEPIAMRLHMGHGGAPGMDASWKLDPVRAGGGALIDPGIHLLNLAQKAGGDCEVVGGTTWDGFWRTGIEEECHLLLRGTRVPSISVSVSVVHWRSEFRMEFRGTDGYGVVDGRGRSYGPQRYTRGRRWGWRSAPSQVESEELVVVDDGEDVFVRETAAFLFPTETSPAPCDLSEALATMELLDSCRRAVGLATEPPMKK